MGKRKHLVRKSERERDTLTDDWKDRAKAHAVCHSQYFYKPIKHTHALPTRTQNTAHIHVCIWVVTEAVIYKFMHPIDILCKTIPKNVRVCMFILHNIYRTFDWHQCPPFSADITHRKSVIFIHRSTIHSIVQYTT